MDNDQYQRDFLELFETNGWEHIVREAEEEVEAIKEHMATAEMNIERLYFLKGQIQQLRVVSNLEYLFKQPQQEGEVYDADI